MHLQKPYTLVRLQKMLAQVGKVRHPHLPDLEAFTILQGILDQQVERFKLQVAVVIILKELFVVQVVVQRVELLDLLQV